jgi:hypothetical protein
MTVENKSVTQKRTITSFTNYLTSILSHLYKKFSLSKKNERYQIRSLSSLCIQMYRAPTMFYDGAVIDGLSYNTDISL